MAKWLSEAVFYEIYPQSFMDSNGDGIGDLKGIISKLDYIKELGCNAIWVNPCFESPFMDAGYDISDYYKIAPRYGTNEDAIELFKEVHKRGMHILFDLVPGHTSYQHYWFQESMKAEKNEYTDRYVWTDDVWLEPEGYATLRGISDRNGSCITNFFSTQPALNYGFYEVKEKWQQSTDAEGPTQTLDEMINVIRFWLSKGLDGFRVDMAGSLVKNDPDSLGTIALWQKVRTFLDEEFPEAAFVSEWGEPDKSLLGGFHMDFLLHFGPSHYNDLFRCEHPFFSRTGEGDASEFIAKYIENYEKTDGKGLICIPSGNHDMDRLARRLDEEERKIAFAFLLSMPGAPFIYYGDEIGMRYVEGLKSVEGGFNRTGSRTPMQWDEELPNAGFSSASADKLYIVQDSSKTRPTAKEELERADSLINEIKRIIEVRRNNPALGNNGKIEFLLKNKKQPLVYIRTAEDQKVLVIINPSKMKYDVSLDGVIRKKLYSNDGKDICIKNNQILIPGEFAGFYII